MARRLFPKFRFSIKNLLVLVLGIAIGFALNAWTLQMRLGAFGPWLRHRVISSSRMMSCGSA